jgi:hypothetical protein
MKVKYEGLKYDSAAHTATRNVRSMQTILRFKDNK